MRSAVWRGSKEINVFIPLDIKAEKLGDLRQGQAPVKFYFVIVKPVHQRRFVVWFLFGITVTSRRANSLKIELLH